MIEFNFDYFSDVQAMSIQGKVEELSRLLEGGQKIRFNDGTICSNKEEQEAVLKKRNIL